MNTKKKSHKNGKYLVNNPLLIFYLRMLDFVTKPLVKKKSVCKINSGKVQKILVSSIAHRGDVVIATSVIPLLRSTFSKAKIDVLLGSWSKPVLINHPDVHNIITFDHWRLNRGKSGVRKIWDFLSTALKALLVIKKNKYDLAIDLYPYYPNSNFLIWAARVPVRLGYVSGGGGGFLSIGMEWSNLPLHMAEHHRKMLHDGLGCIDGAEIRYSLHEPNISQYSQFFHLTQKKYVVVHQGAGNPKREWRLEGWDKVVECTVNAGYGVVLTGSSASERQVADVLCRGRAGCINGCSKMSWEEFLFVIRHASLLVSVDTVAGHLAAAYDVPSIIIMTGMTDPRLFGPLSRKKRMISDKSLSCFPCFRSEGCKGMECIMNVKSDDVVESIMDVMEHVL